MDKWFVAGSNSVKSLQKNRCDRDDKDDRAACADSCTVFVGDGCFRCLPLAVAAPSVTSTIDVGDVPFTVAFTPNGKKAYVTNADDDTGVR